MAETSMPGSLSPGYPVDLQMEPSLENRNRVTVGFRIILAIPQLILAGGPGIAIGAIGWSSGSWGYVGNLSGGGVLGAVAGVGAVIAWFAIIFANQHPRGLWDFAAFYMRWHTKVTAYVALFRDEYPPFGDADYPVRYDTAYPEGARDKLSVGLRIIYAIPHLVILFFLGIAWFFTTVVAWFSIVFTGNYPPGLYDFGMKVWRWQVRVETYLLLMRDEYPPFSLEA